MNPIEQKLAELSKDFIQGLPTRLLDIASGWQQFLASRDKSALEPVHRGLHSLAGSSALYNCAEMGLLARKIETTLHDFIQDESLLLQDELEQFVDDHLVQLGRVVENDGQAPDLESSPGNDNDGFTFMMGGLNSSPSKVLIVEDDPDSREYLRLILSELGHEVIEAESGEQAIVQYLQNAPDIILMDIIMPGMNGYEATREIKELASDYFVPVIFLTSITDERMLARCIESGGDDFVNKPFSRVVINSKITAMQRIKALNQKLEHYRKSNEEEIRQAKHMFEAVLRRGGKWPQGVDAWAIAAGNFSGDIQLVYQLEGDLVYVFQGDFTGHGLSPAVGTVLASDIFYRMAADGAPAEKILLKINNSLNEILPTGKYCATGLLCIDAGQRTIRIWNCGIPEIYCLDEEGEVIHVVPSVNMPLGIMKRKTADFESEQLDFGHIEHVVLYTDGITEAENCAGVMYGEERLIKSFRMNGGEKNMIQQVKLALNKYTDGCEQLDDISIVAIDLSLL